MQQYYPSAPPDYPGAPPAYGQATGSFPASLTAVGLQAVDFLPLMTAEDGPSDRPEYERFNILVERANHFLRDNPHCTVNTCESVEFSVCDGGWEIDTVQSVFVAYGDSNNRYIRGLRLWIQPRSTSAAVSQFEPDQIGYVNFLPDIQRDDAPQRLDIVLERINRTQIKGRIITVETQPIKWGNSALDPDRTIWTERGMARDRFINLVRIFYIRGAVEHLQVGLEDFVPAVLEKATASSNPRMETFPMVMQRVQKWLLSVPPHFRPVNVQTVMFRWSYNKGIDTKDMTYHENKTLLNYLRFLRVAYVIENPDSGPVSRSTIQLGSKLMVPEMIQQPVFLDQEAVAKLRQAAHDAAAASKTAAFESRNASIKSGETDLISLEAALKSQESAFTMQQVALKAQEAAFRLQESVTRSQKGEFETQESCRRRLDAWLKTTGAGVVSVETLVMRIVGGGESVYGFDAMHTWNEMHLSLSGTRNLTKRDDERFALMYRIYTDEIVPEPGGTVAKSRLENFTIYSGSGERDYAKFSHKS
ncbi:uncharacterized protein LOC129590542 [Paramacrobiotus metropolitanus]|uniref:uncharacterized protein LOC129590542 n=1 Tax=Paramacrobiotus metropolitanus TaxID=2943436 RepID=UPI002446258E|nr:uncharacterized protein LOC129590542 [Paramacrobiotus metropolitanus]